MKKYFLQLLFITGLCSTITPAFALSDTYFSTGEDLDYIIESDSKTALLELEYRLRRFVIFRKLEDFFLDLTDFEQSEDKG